MHPYIFFWISVNLTVGMHLVYHYSTNTTTLVHIFFVPPSLLDSSFLWNDFYTCSYTFLMLIIIRALQNTYPTRYICMYLRAAGAASMYVFVDDLYLRMLGKLCARAESTWSAVAWVVGTVSRHGQWKCTICVAHGPCQRNRSIMKPVLRQFQGIHCAYKSLRCLDLKMWRFSCWRQTTTDDDRQW